MEFTGERMVPERADPATFWHHIYRYKFAIPYCRGKRALDVACGEGYGCASILKGGATSVIGVDISEEACRHARERYQVDARPGSAESLPIPTASIDTVVTFETIEHVPHPENFVRECHRVLAPGGMMILSSPNRDLYRLRNGLNPYHCSEMSETEVISLLGNYFEITGVYGQYPEMRPAGLMNPGLWRFAPWTVMKGMNRVRRMTRARWGNYFFTVPNEYYDDPALAVLNETPDKCRILNPNIVRPRPRANHVDFVFYIITATRKS